MKRYFILFFLVLFVSCNSSKENVYTTNAVCTFDYSDAAELTGADGVYFDKYFLGSGVLAFCNKVQAGEFLGGCALVGLSDDTLEEGHVAEPLCAFGGGCNNSKYYVTIKFDPSPSAMPEHLIVFMQSDHGRLSPVSCKINNTNRMVNIASFGLPAHDGEAPIPPFADGDYLKVRIYSTSGTARVSDKYVEFTLAEHSNGALSVCKEWTEVDLSSLGNIENIDVALTSNRSDLPMAFCIDNFALAATINM